MKLVIISLGLFFSMKLVYGFWGDYHSNYWSAIYYITNYFMMITLFWYMYLQSRSIMQRWFFGLAVVYFLALLLLNVVCLFKISLFTTLVSDVGYFGVGAILLTIGILFINYKIRKKPCQKNLDKKHYSRL